MATYIIIDEIPERCRAIAQKSLDELRELAKETGGRVIRVTGGDELTGGPNAFKEAPHLFKHLMDSMGIEA